MPTQFFVPSLHSVVVSVFDVDVACEVNMMVGDFAVVVAVGVVGAVAGTVRVV